MSNLPPPTLEKHSAVSLVSGGQDRVATEQSDWAAGSLYEDYQLNQTLL
jgi:hypothetical protein